MSGGKVNLTRGFVLGMGLIWMILNAIHLIPAVESELSRMRHNLHRSRESRFDLHHPRNLRPFCEHLVDTVPEDQTVVIPPKEAVPFYQIRLSQPEVMRYLLFPRKLIRSADFQTLKKADAIVVSEEFPKQYPRDHFTPFPCTDHPLRVQVYLDKIRIRSRKGRILFSDNFRYPKDIERIHQGRPRSAFLSTLSAAMKHPEKRFGLLSSQYDLFKSYEHLITTERSKNDHYAEKMDVQIGPMLDTWYGYPIEGIPLSEIGELEVWVWATERNILRVGLRFDNDQFIRSVRNQRSHSWERLGFDDRDQLLLDHEIQEIEGRSAVMVVLTLEDRNFLKDIGLILNNP